MSDDKIYQEPSKVSAEDGVVSVKGPDAVDVKMTADAADETSDRLLHGALQARGQKVSKKARREKNHGPGAGGQAQGPGPLSP